MKIVTIESLEEVEPEKIYQIDREIEKREKIQVTGFSSPGEKYSADRINLNKSLIRNSNTYIYQTRGDSMIDLGIMPGAFIVFEQRLNYFSGDVCVVRLDKEYFVRQLLVENGVRYLCPANEANPNYKRVEVNEFLDFELCGTVINSINTHRRIKAQVTVNQQRKSAKPKSLNAQKC